MTVGVQQNAIRVEDHHAIVHPAARLGKGQGQQPRAALGIQSGQAQFDALGIRGRKGPAVPEMTAVSGGDEDPAQFDFVDGIANGHAGTADRALGDFALAPEQRAATIEQFDGRLGLGQEGLGLLENRAGDGQQIGAAAFGGVGGVLPWAGNDGNTRRHGRRFAHLCSLAGLCNLGAG